MHMENKKREDNGEGKERWGEFGSKGHINVRHESGQTFPRRR